METVESNPTPNITAWTLFVSTFLVIILMVGIKVWCRQIALQENIGRNVIGIQPPKNLDSLILNLFLLLLVASSMALYMVYWNE